MTHKQTFPHKDYKFQLDKQSQIQYRRSSILSHIYVQSFHPKVWGFKILRCSNNQLHMVKQLLRYQLLQLNQDSISEQDN